uniref:Titin n=1 Tax=Oryzias latipes TaxID=8090 RepID=A0A3P9KQV3_ORYLA
MINIRAACTLRLFVPVRGRPAPEIKWGKADGEIKETAQIDNTGNYASLVIENVDRFDSGKYTLTAENASGVKSVFISVRVLDSPSPPTNFMVKEITKNSVTLTWEPPLLDGGSKIKHYIVEKRESTRKVYSPITTCNKMSLKVESLPEGGIFFFRVLAENEYGVGLQAKTIEPIKISEKPQPPGKVSVVDVSRSTVSLKWEKPIHDGGSRVSHYEVEMAPKDSDTWSLCASVKSLETTVASLLQGEEYQFRVVAVNDKGKSDPRQLAHSVVAKDLTIEPSIRPKASTYSVQVGYDLKIKVPIAGHPKPTITWTKDGTIQAISYKVTKLLPGNEYIFRVTAVNKYGVGEPLESEPVIARNPFTVPSAPSTPEVSAVTRDSIVLTWERPEENGGAEIEGYILEKRDKDGIRWTKCNKKRLNDLRFRCTGLTEGHYYEFRVSAENAAGTGKPSAPSQYIKACDATYPPGPPSNPKVTNHSRYVIEMKEAGDDEWIICSPPTGVQRVGEPVDLPGSVIAAEKLEAPEIELDADLRKMVNVRATATLRLFVTIRGKPEPEVKWSKNLSGSKSAFINVRVLDSPSAPTNLEVKDVKRNSVSLSWEPPLIDGGAKISHYIVEKREQKRMAFTSVCTNCVRNSYIVSDLQEGGRYYFRVLAVNELGVGLPASTDQVKVSEAPLPPGKVVVEDITRHSVTLSWEKPDHDGGSKITSYIVEMQPKGEDKWTLCRNEYIFRVRGVNKYGDGEALESEPVKAMDPFTVPAAPTNVQVTAVTSDAMTICWERPVRVTGYIVEALEKGQEKWVKCGATKFTHLTVSGLRENAEYFFRVRAENHAGLSDVKETIIPNTISLAWEKPNYDGGSPITGYFIEKRDGANSKWSKANLTNITDSHFTVTGLTQDETYEFRVKARNAVGSISSPSITAGPATCVDTYGKFLGFFALV